MWLIIIVVFIILLVKEKNKVEELLEENRRLKKELENMKKTNLSENVFDKGVGNLRIEQNINRIEEPVKQLTNEEKRNIYIEKEKKEIEGRNTLILITGAILIVLAAIVFLMSTWYTIPNLLKTIVLILLIVVFFGASNIAKEKFKLPKASITFFYIAMAYIPICLFSISFFGLLGNYLSITGEGNYIYLTISAIFTSIIYYLIYRNKNNEVLFIGSILAQVLSVILFTLIFSNKLELIIFNLALYNLLFIILTKDNNTITKLPYIHSIIPYTVCFITVCTIESTSTIALINFIILAINFIILEVKENKLYHAFGFNIAINIIGNYFIWNLGENVLENTKIIFSLIYTILIFIMENIILIGKNKSNLKKSCLIITMGTLQLLFFNSLDNKNILIKPFIISFIQCIISILGYLQLEKKGVVSYLIPIYFIISGITLLNLYKLEYHYYIIFAVVTFLLGESLKEKRLLKIKESSFIISNIFIATVYTVIAIVNNEEFKNDIIYFVALLFINIHSYLRTKNIILKYLAYFNFYILIYVFAEVLKLNNNNYINNIIFIACSIFCYIFERKPRDKDIFKVLTYIGSLILYNTIIEEIELSEYALFTFLGYIIITILILRRILEKYIDKHDVDIIEAIIIGLIYLIAIFSYSGEYDGILFGILIVSMLMFSYIKKHGTLFLVNIGAILINVFLLTREFWFSIPWWIYLLIIGSALITFAIKNEFNEKKNKFNIKDSLKRIKDGIEK